MNQKSALLTKLKPNSRERRIYENLESKAEDILKFFPAHATYYTDHGKDHSKRIIENLGRILTDVGIKKLNHVEAFILLCSAWLHDIGYIVDERDGRKLSDREIQKLHHELSEYVIKKYYPELGIEDEATATLIGNICASHRREVIIAKKLLRETEALKGAAIKSHFIAALFSLADALDTDTRRAPEMRSKYVSNLPKESKRHWKVCQRISGFIPEPQNLSITLDANFRKKQDLEDILWKLMHLQDELDRVSTILIKNGLPYVKIQGRLQGKKKLVVYDMMQLKRQTAQIPFDPTKYLDLNVNYSIDVDHEGNAWIQRETSFMNVSDSELKEREHRAYCSDSGATWDWEKDIVVQGGSIKIINDRPMRKSYAVVFQKGIPPNKTHSYSVKFYWPKMFPKKEEGFTGHDTSFNVTHNLILPEDVRVKKLHYIERFRDGWHKDAKVLNKKDTPVRGGKTLRSISLLKEDRYSETEIRWEIE